jgi:hypothetical protein
MPIGEENRAPSERAEQQSTSPFYTREINKETLRKFIVECFDLEEFKLLCHDLEVKFDSLSGQTIDGKADALVNHLWRHSERQGLENLIGALKGQRPIPWGQWFGAKIESSSSPSDAQKSTRKPLPWEMRVIPETGEVVSGWLLSALRDPIWQGIAGVVAILAFFVTLYEVVLTPGMARPPTIAILTPSWTPSAIVTSIILHTPTPSLSLSPGPTPTAPHTMTPVPSPVSTPWGLASAQIYPEKGADCATVATVVSDSPRPGAIKIMFDTVSDGSWCTWVVGLGKFGASQKTRLSFWVKGEKGGEQFGVGLKDYSTVSGDEPKITLMAPSEWEQVFISLQDMQKIKKQNLAELDNFSLGFTHQLGSGVIYVQGFVFEP